MSRSKSMLALAAGTAFAGSAAQASVLPFNFGNGSTSPVGGLYTLTPVPIPSGAAFNPQTSTGATTDDPALANYCVFDLQVVVSSASGQDRWASADLRGQLNGGSQFYIPPSNPSDPTVPVDNNYLQAAGVRNVPGQRYLQVDTMVMSPVGSASRGGILGKSTFAPATQTGEIFPSNGSNFLDSNDPNRTTFLPANSMNLIDVAWGDSTAALQPAGSNGTFTIARFTIKPGPNAADFAFIGRIGSTLNPSQPASFTFALIPEPAAAIPMLCAGLSAVILRRRK